jgi:DNA-binding transcriptional ArsR family regulator
MPRLSIVPAAAVTDTALEHAHLRVLCAIGIHTDASGAGAWTSVATLCREAGVSESTVHRALTALSERGYIRITHRTGRSNLYEVVLQGVSPVTEGGATDDTPGVSPVTPKRPQRTTPITKAPKVTAEERQLVRELWSLYPQREGEQPYIPAERAIVALLRTGVDPQRLANAIRGYRRYLEHEGWVGSRFVRTMARFFGEEEHWLQYDVVRVYGRTREEWMQSGQDVTEFDRLAAHNAQEVAHV